MVKICIFGAGAIGGHIGGHIARSGQCELSIVARGTTLAAIRENGLRVETPDGSFVTHPSATDDPATLGPQDYLLLTVKAHQMPAVLPRIKPLVGEHTAILPPTTGLPAAFLHGLAGPCGNRPLRRIDPDGAQMRAMPADQVLGIVYWIGAHGEGPAMVRQDGPRASCMVGELDGTISERATTLATLLTESGIPTPVRPSIRTDIWVKFVNSLCWNPAALLTLATNGAIGGHAETQATVRRMMEEADALAGKIGIPIPISPEKRIAVTTSARGHKMSMLQDFEHDRQLELDILIQSIRAMKELANLPTPTIDAVLALAELRAETARQQEIAA